MKKFVFCFLIGCMGCNSSTPPAAADSNEDTVTIAAETPLPAEAIDSAQAELLVEQPAEEEVAAQPTETKIPVKENHTSQSIPNALWTKIDAMRMPDLERRISPTTFSAYRCNFPSLMATLVGETPSVTVPTRNGMVTFELQNSNTMNPALAAKFPTIKSYKGKSKDGALSIRLDTNDEGLFVEVTGTGVKDLLTPLLKGEKTYYALYGEEALPGSPRDKTYR